MKNILKNKILSIHIRFVILLVLIGVANNTDTVQAEIIKENTPGKVYSFDKDSKYNFSDSAEYEASNDNNTYGEWFRIDKKEKGKCKELDTKIDNFAFNMIGYLVDQDNKLELEHNWEWLYGRLGTGEYRIVKEVNNQYIYAFFKI